MPDRRGIRVCWRFCRYGSGAMGGDEFPFPPLPRLGNGGDAFESHPRTSSRTVIISVGLLSITTIASRSEIYCIVALPDHHYWPDRGYSPASSIQPELKQSATLVIGSVGPIAHSPLTPLPISIPHTLHLQTRTFLASRIPRLPNPLPRLRSFRHRRRLRVPSGRFGSMLRRRRHRRRFHVGVFFRYGEKLHSNVLRKAGEKIDVVYDRWNAPGYSGLVTEPSEPV